jgi:bifunctional N-acetylglucosamine-1-phosphate-uridyltransferase/glucosamine-1-phosphate-acetyltransferase GlmU-like protein
MVQLELLIGEAEEAYVRCGVPVEYRTPEHFFLEREGKDQRLYAIPGELKIDEKPYELTEKGALISKEGFTHLDNGVELGGRTKIERDARILGRSSVGRSCHILEGASIEEH